MNINNLSNPIVSTVSQTTINHSLLVLGAFLAFKYTGMVIGIVLLISIVLGFAGIDLLAAGSVQNTSNYGFFENIMRQYIWGLLYTAPSYSDLMAFVLLAFVGTDFDYTINFYKLNFFIIPAILLIPRLIISAKVAMNGNYYNFISFLYAMFYSLAPLAITASAYY